MALVTRLQVTPVDAKGQTAGEVWVADIDMRTIMAWETKFPGRSLSTLNARGSMSAHDMYELAFIASARGGRATSATLAEFVEQHEVHGALSAEEVAEPEPDPILKDHSTED
jgi:hypothetical protein